MTSRERMLIALDLGVPDRLPASVHGWMTYYLQNYLDGITAIDAFRKFGLDWSLYLPWEVWSWKPDDNWIVEKTEKEIESNRTEVVTSIKTQEKTFRQVVQRDKYSSPWITEHLLKEPEDIFIYGKYHPPKIFNHETADEMFRTLGDNGILRCPMIGQWHSLCELYGAEKMIYACFDDPQWVKDAMTLLAEMDLNALETMKGAPVDLLETGGGHGSSTVVSPDIFSAFILPVEREVHTFVRDELGLRTVYHTCGGMMPILDLLVEMGSSAIETLTPPSMGGDVDLAKVKMRFGDRVALIGGFDQYTGFENGTPDDTRRLVRHCFETAGAGGGYIMNPSDHFFDGATENVEAYADEARKCMY